MGASGWAAGRTKLTVFVSFCPCESDLFWDVSVLLFDLGLLEVSVLGDGVGDGDGEDHDDNADDDDHVDWFGCSAGSDSSC